MIYARQKCTRKKMDVSSFFAFPPKEIFHGPVIFHVYNPQVNIKIKFKLLRTQSCWISVGYCYFSHATCFHSDPMSESISANQNKGSRHPWETHCVLFTFRLPHTIRQPQTQANLSSWEEPVPWHTRVLKGHHLARSRSETL